VVVDSTRPESGGSDATNTAQQATATATPTASTRKRKPRRRTYTIRTGDTPSGIAEKVDVPLETLLELNPDLDPQTLTPGTKLKLR
jgi:LysM repeat protein